MTRFPPKVATPESGDATSPTSNANASLPLEFRDAVLSLLRDLRESLEGCTDAGEHVTRFPQKLGTVVGGDANSVSSKKHVVLRDFPEGAASGDWLELGELLARFSLEDVRNGETCFNGFNGKRAFLDDP